MREQGHVHTKPSYELIVRIATGIVKRIYHDALTLSTFPRFLVIVIARRSTNVHIKMGNNQYEHVLMG